MTLTLQLVVGLDAPTQAFLGGLMSKSNDQVVAKIEEVMTHVAALEARDATTKQLLADLKAQSADAGLPAEILSKFDDIDAHLDSVLKVDVAPEPAPAT